MNKLLFILLLFTIIGETKEFRLDTPGYSMENVKVRNQGRSGFCYAYAASTLINAWQYSHDKSMDNSVSILSAIVWMAIDNKDSYRTSLNIGGWVYEALNSVKSRGYCIEEDTYSLSRNIKKINKYWVSLDVEKIDLPDERKLDYLNVLINSACHLTPLSYNVKKIVNTNTFPKVINDTFGHGKKSQPIGIKYCADILYKQDHKFLLAKDGTGTCHMHYSVIIGENDKQYLVRDSYGNDCGESLYGSKIWRCEHGTFWITKQNLLDNLLELDILE